VWIPSASPPADRGRTDRKVATTEPVNPIPGVLRYTRIKKSPYYCGSRRHGVALYSVYNHHYHPPAPLR
jgi:hypothetical protein